MFRGAFAFLYVGLYLGEHNLTGTERITGSGVFLCFEKINAFFEDTFQRNFTQRNALRFIVSLEEILL